MTLDIILTNSDVIGIVHTIPTIVGTVHRTSLCLLLLT